MSASEKGRDQAVVLVSGGLDSATVLAMACRKHSTVSALTIDYNQRHRCELEAARRVTRGAGVQKHLILPIDLRSFGGSSLTSDLEIPQERTLGEMESGIPNTYVPARNTIFLSLALGWGEVLGARTIWIGVNAVDYSGYPDCRPEFIQAFEQLAKLATKAGVEGETWKIETPLIDLRKSAIIRKGRELNVDYSLTHSCYDPQSGDIACGRCDSCRIRYQGFLDAGLVDPIPYAHRPDFS